MARLQLTSDALPDGGRVVSLRGEEVLAEPFWFEIALAVPDSDCVDLDFDATMGAEATLTMAPGDGRGPEYPYHGVIDELELVHAEAGQALLLVVLVPELMVLGRSRHSRVYTDVTIEDVIRDVFRRADLTHELEFRLSEEHPTEEHITQYRESDLAFLTRWIEREGIVYWFEHDDGPKVVFADSTSAALACRSDAVPYHPTAGEDVSAGESLGQLTERFGASPSKVRVVDYDPVKPTLAVEGEAGIEGGLEASWVRFEDRTFTPDDAGRLAKLEAERQRSKREKISAAGHVLGLRPGHVFALEGHPLARLDVEHFVHRCEHRARQADGVGWLREVLGHDMGSGYHVSLELSPREVPYRPPRATPWPRAVGYEIGFVEGPADHDYAQLDEHGRYHVKLFADESDAAGDAASTWLRMVQPHGGNPEGWHFPLRKGTEVVVAFVGGDPDRPVIAGAVPNAETPSPVTSANHSQNVLQTGGSNRLEMEDADGEQHIWISTPPKDTYLHLGEPFDPPTHHIVLHTEADGLFDIGGNQDIDVGGALHETVGSDVTETYGSQDTLVEGPQDTTVGSDVTEIYGSALTTTVGSGDRQESIGGAHITTVAGPREEDYGSQTELNAGAGVENWAASHTRTTGGETKEMHLPVLIETVSGAVVEVMPTLKEDYGATTWFYGPLTWVGGSITMNAPNWKLTTPNQFRWQASDDWVEATKCDSTSISVGATVLQLTATRAAAGATGAKLELTRASIGAVAFKVAAGIFNVSLTGGEAEIDGNKIFA